MKDFLLKRPFFERGDLGSCFFQGGGFRQGLLGAAGHPGGEMLVLEGPFVGAKKRTQVGARAKKVQEEQRILDSLLVEKAKGGDLASFQSLVERYQSKAHSIALGVLGSHEDAEDVTQEAFLKAFRNLSSFREQSSFYTWFYRIVFNLSIDLSRKSFRKSEVSVDSSPTLEKSASLPKESNFGYVSHIDGPEASFERSELQKGFSQALASLSAEHRAVIVLREIDGLSYEEISSVVGCSKGTVMSRLHHARKRLQLALKDHYNSGLDGSSKNEIGQPEIEPVPTAKVKNLRVNNK